MQKFYGFCVHAIEYLSAILFSVLAVAAFLKTAYVKNAYEIVIQLTWDNPILNLLFLAVFALLLWLLGEFFSHRKHGAQILLVLTCIWVFCASMLWTYFSKSGPASDCGSVYYAAKQFAKNDFSAISYRDSYFSVYPFQLGLAFFYELIFRLVRNDNFHILQGINAICLVICTISQYHLSRYFFKEKKVHIYGLLLTASCIPFIMYGSYIYGEIPSFAFLLSGSALLLSFWKTGKIRYGILSVLAITLSVMVRKNSLIFLIALTIISVLLLIKKHRELSSRAKLLFISQFLILVVLSTQILPMVQHMYANRTRTELNSGIPSSTYLAMGLMEADAGPGHYSGYNFDTFTVSADYDADLASEIGWTDYKHQVDLFLSHPGYALSFMTEKFLDQWLNAGWAIFDSIYVSFGERLPIIESCFSGSLYHVLIEYMSGYQLVLYFFTAIGCLALLPKFQRKRKNGMPSLGFDKCDLKSGKSNFDSGKYDVTSETSGLDTGLIQNSPCHLLFLLTAFGGFLVYTAWEASGRYILPYAIFVLPNAAFGAHIFINQCKGLFLKWKKK